MSDTELSSRWPHRELRPERSPLLHSPAPSLPSLPCGLLSCCFGVTRPTCRSSLAGWPTLEREVGGSGIRGKWAGSHLIISLCFFWKFKLDITLNEFSFSSASSSYSSEQWPSHKNIYKALRVSHFKGRRINVITKHMCCLVCFLKNQTQCWSLKGRQTTTETTSIYFEK